MINRFKQVTDIYVHASCPDGTAAALICAKVAKILKVDPHIHFIQYQTTEHLSLEARPNQLFVDITPPLTRWQEWVKFNPIVLDHHKTAATAAQALGVFDDTRSGALLAYEHLMYPVRHSMTEREQDKLHQWERFAKLIAIRDLWHTNDLDWNDAAAMSHGLLAAGHRELLESVDDLDFSQIHKLGELVFNKIRRKTKIIVESSHTCTEKIGATEIRFIIFNLTEPTFSDISEFLRTDYGFDVSVSYFYMHGDNPQVVISLRSNDKFNVRRLAEKFGGGGHDRAAGYRLQGLPGPDSIVEQVIQACKVL